jgi:hypothetical protein
MKIRNWIPVTAVLLAAPLQASTPPGAVQGDWTAWYGCWVAVESESGVTPVVCVLPGADASTARIATIEDGRISEETVVRADGVARPIEEGGCSGAESAFFSEDGRRVFTRAELGCSGLGRLSTGVLAMISPDEWVDAQAMTVNGQHAVRTMRYRAARSSEIPAWVAADLPRDQALAQEVARLDASRPLEIADVAEATRHVAAPAVEALLAARQHGFGLNAAKLMELRDSGVPTSTIDVMVALSYPARFAVAQDDRRAGVRSDGDVNAARSWVESCYDDPFYSARRSGCYTSRYGYGYSRRGGLYGYSPYGYDPYGWNYGTRPVIVIVQPDGDGSSDSGGAVVKGRGYTRTGSTMGTAEPRGATERSQPAASTGSTTTKATPSSSSGGSTTTRTAKPRGGNNN